MMHSVSVVATILLLITALTRSEAFVSIGAKAFVGATSLSMADTMATTVTPEVKVGDKIPSIDLSEGQPDYESPVTVNIAELCAGKKVAIFAVPGAFTPGCSMSHLPSFIDGQDELKAKGVELTICIATNDPYVMEAWASSSGGKDAGIRFLSDASGDLTKALGLGLEKEGALTLRTKRFSLVADDGVVTHYFPSDEDKSNTYAPSVVAAL
mmetsp:Transcript_14383/g.21093  ORF Transcript_14383/g.21093 Transcript_14383/m.21093 type:complete len:211 (-) Transcript_14383:45-677(-)|eukprot:CAMPEP_0194047030 /NCGR_PEP_ID=MMETSP0009_2-20130614/23520_1 /TAXON_ID=210454 /ORGANISM="Grammatophora oceanica, Strain CCMP 410" /LENGTH=210 /DNA_ID=CAMNT_0038692541 /DNA_START=28 /DNA_END=660 /DNA_ORIENTATION=-